MVLIVCASVSVILLSCNSFWFTDVWTMLIHFPHQTLRKWPSKLLFLSASFMDTFILTCWVKCINMWRLEKLCPPDGRKVRMRQEENVSSFQLNSSLVPGKVFNCHLELVLNHPDSGETDIIGSCACAWVLWVNHVSS